MVYQAHRDDAGALAALAGAFRDAAAREFPPTSPLYARLAAGAAGDGDLLALVLAAPPAQRRATLLLAAVHDLLLADPGQPLAAWYLDLAPGAPATGDPYPAFRACCLAHRDALAHRLATRATQTNEAGRCAGLLPAVATVARLAGECPLALIEIGASAGLNLRLDRYAYDYGAGRLAGDPHAPVRLTCALRGPLAPPLLATMPRIASRVGLDLAPLDARDPVAARWLRACVWPEAAGRRALLERALADARDDPPPLVAGDALAALPGLVAAIPRGTPICLFHTATLAYFAREERARFAALVSTLAAGRELYWLSGEGPGPLHAAAYARAVAWRRASEEARVTAGVPPASVHWLVLTTFRAGQATERLLAGMDPHGAWLEWLDDTSACASQFPGAGCL